MIVIINRVTALPAEPLPAASTRDRLVAAAIEVFVAQGYERARVHDIARTAGLTTGAIYANYRGKADLLFDAIGSRAGAEVDALLQQASGPDARAVLELLGTQLVRPAGPPPLLLDAIAAARRDDDLATLLRERIAGRERQLGDLVERAKGEDVIDDAVDTDAFARFCTTLAAGALVMRTLGLEAPDRSVWQALIHRLLEAIAPREETQQ